MPSEKGGQETNRKGRDRNERRRGGHEGKGTKGRMGREGRGKGNVSGRKRTVEFASLDE